MAEIETHKVNQAATAITNAEGSLGLYTEDEEGTLLGLKGHIIVTCIDSAAAYKNAKIGIKISPAGTDVVDLIAATQTFSASEAYFAIATWQLASYNQNETFFIPVDIKVKREMRETDTLRVFHIADDNSDWFLAYTLVFSVLHG